MRGFYERYSSWLTLRSYSEVVLEKLAHIDPAMLPSDLVLARFDGDLSAETWIDLSNLSDLRLTRERGDAFLENRRRSRRPEFQVHATAQQYKGRRHHPGPGGVPGGIGATTASDRHAEFDLAQLLLNALSAYIGVQ
jgi:hypothetical protein